MMSQLITFSFMTAAAWGQAGNYGNRDFSVPENAGGQRITVTDSARTRSTRAVNPMYGSYPAERVAANPRYADGQRDGVPVGNNGRVAADDPQSSLAAKLLRDMIPLATDVNVNHWRLYDALERTGNSQQQFEAIKAYWKWTLAHAELQGVLEEDALLARANAPRTTHEQAAHQAARHASQARIEDSKLDVSTRFVELQHVTGSRSRNIPVPADIPFVNAYNTNIERIFPQGSAPLNLRKIDLTLPLILKVVRTRADSLAAAKQALATAEAAYQAGQMPHADLMESLALVRNQRRAFLDSIHDYNFGIAEYALTAAGPGLPRETVVSMLIRVSSPTYRGASTNIDTGANEGFVQPVSLWQESN